VGDPEGKIGPIRRKYPVFTLLNSEIEQRRVRFRLPAPPFNLLFPFKNKEAVLNRLSAATTRGTYGAPRKQISTDWYLPKSP